MLFLYICGDGLFLGVPSAVPSGLSCLGFIEFDQFGVRFVDQTVRDPGVVIHLAEFYTDQVFSVLRTGIQVHISLVTLIDPAQMGHLVLTFGAGDGDQSVIGKGVGFAVVTGKHDVFNGFPLIIAGALSRQCG